MLVDQAVRTDGAQRADTSWRAWGLLAMFFVLLGAAALRLLGLFDVPSGILYDEAYNALDAEHAFTHLTPFLHENFGRESAFIYLQAISIQVFGYSPFAMRFPMALIGLLTVAATYPLFTLLFGRAVGIMSAGWLAWSFWHVMFSRTGLRVGALPLVIALTCYCLAKAVAQVETPASASGQASRKAYLWFVLTGALLGLAQYSYSVARFAPLVIVAIAVLRAIANRARARQYAAGIGLAGLIACLFYLPLGLYFLAHPADFFERAGQVSAFTQGKDPRDELLFAIRATLGMFGAQGDASWDRNIAGAPLFDPVTYALFLLGIGVALARCRRWPTQFALTWFLVMLVPHAVTSAFAPNFGRSIGIVPVLFAFPALGLHFVAARVAENHRHLRAVIIVLIGTAVLAGTTYTAWRYFFVWNTTLEAQETFHASLARQYAAAYQVPLGKPRARLYVAVPGASSGVDPVRFFLPRSTRPRPVPGLAEPDELRPFIAGDSLVLPPKGQRAVYVVGWPIQLPRGLAERYLPGATDVTGAAGIRTISADIPALTVERPFEARWGDYVDLIGYSLPQRGAAGEELQFVLYWKTRAQVTLNARMFAHLVDARGEALAKVDADVSLFDVRTPDEVVVQSFGLSVPKDATTGAYWVSVGMYTNPGARRVRVFDPLGRDAGDSFVAGPVKIGSAAPATAPANRDARFWFGEQIGLAGFDVDRATARPGEQINVNLRWLTRRTPAADYTIFLQLLDSRQRLVGQVDVPPLGGAYPTSLWDPGETTTDRLALPIAPGTQPEKMTIIVGLYDKAGSRLPVANADGVPQGDFAVLDTVEVVR